MDYEEKTKALFLSSEEGLFPTVEDGAKLAENIIDSLRIWIDNNNYSVEIVFYVCEGSADKKDKKRTKDVAPHYHILMLGNPAEKIVEVIEKYIESKINRDCHLDAEEVYDLDTLLRYIIPQCKKIRSMALDKKGLGQHRIYRKNIGFKRKTPGNQAECVRDILFLVHKANQIRPTEIFCQPDKGSPMRT